MNYFLGYQGRVAVVSHRIRIIQSNSDYCMSSDQSQSAYSSEEVVWAKVNGDESMQVDKVHWQEEEMEYTVQFFGDQTHSKLGASKLNKFSPHYAEHYTRARAHRRLMASIQAAERQLSQNNQDVSVYRSIREELKSRRRSGNVIIKISRDEEESFHSDHSHQLPNLRIAANSACRRTSRSLASQDREQKYEVRSDADKASHRGQSMPGRKTRGAQAVSKKSARQVQDEQEVQQHYNNYISAKLKPAARHQPSMDVQQPQEACLDNHQLMKSPKADFLGQPRLLGEGNDGCREGKRKRGRPRKDASSTPQLVSKSVSQTIKRKPIHKEASKNVTLTVSHVQLSKDDELMVIEAYQTMNNRNQLTNYLNSAPLSTSNILPLLDLGVVDVLQESGYSKQAEQVCDKLKDLLLRKYFPRQFKSKPVLERKASRKKKPVRTVREEEKSDLQLIMNPDECRKKTIAKLYKFLLRKPSNQAKQATGLTAKEMSVQIEAAFFRFDSFMGDNYKSLALKVLKALKDGKEDGVTALQKLRRRDYSV